MTRLSEFDFAKNVMIVAEIGNNHEGKFDVAAELVRKAAEAGVHAVKFQTFRADHFVSLNDQARFNRLQSFELPYEQFRRLCDLARSFGLMFFSTPLDLESARFLEGIVDCYKIASGDNNFYPLIEFVCDTGRPIVFSTGLSDLNQVLRTREFVEARWRTKGISQWLAILHCVSSYPVPLDEANLLSVPFLASRVSCPVGYSDHTLGIHACIAAVALGARIIEKHFTLDKNFSDFRDHQFSADPDEMKRLVEQASQVRRMLGRPEKTVQECEKAGVLLIRRSIAATRDLPSGHRVQREDLMWIRPADGMPPGDEGQIQGKCLKRAISFGEHILRSDVETD